MYLQSLEITNFRQFNFLSLMFDRGLNLLVGENDSGKSTIIDAIKLVTGTHSKEYVRISNDDFYTDGFITENELKIVCVFADLSDDEAAAFLEWLSIFDDKYYLKLTLRGKRTQRNNSITDVYYDIRAGEDEESGAFHGEAKNRLRSTYLKPLRDAEYELAPRRGSRLAQILSAHEIFQKSEDLRHPLEETMDKANIEVTDYFENKDGKIISDTINLEYLDKFSLLHNPLSSKFGISKVDLGRILEKLELTGFSVSKGSSLGLGSNNLLFIAAEMLLLKKDSSYIGLKLSLIEEIEAHLHPQSQLNLIDFLNRESEELGFQSIITSHSNTLASKVDLNNIIICKSGKAFSLKKGNTNLAAVDYKFLSRFLDDTKANLFFCNGLIIVEGDAENLMIPSLAEIIGLPLHKYGVSIVNVGSTALLRYAKIFQRKDGSPMGIKVSCITDRDIPPIEARDFTYEVRRRATGIVEQVSLISDNRKTEDDYTSAEIDKILAEKRQKFEGGDIMVFLPRTWTLEFEIAKSCLREILHKAVVYALETNDLQKELNHDLLKKIKQACEDDFSRWKLAGLTQMQIAVEIYAPLERKLASKAVVAQLFSEILRKSNVDKAIIMKDQDLKYLVDAINHVTNVRPN